MRFGEPAVQRMDPVPVAAKDRLDGAPENVQNKTPQEPTKMTKMGFHD